MPNTCDGCTMCCKTLGVVEIKKLPNRWCVHCNIGQGCIIYDKRPTSCQEYQCLFLLENFPEELRPSECKVVLDSTTDGKSIVAHCDPNDPDATSRGPMNRFLRSMIDQGLLIIVAIGETERRLMYKSSTVDKELLKKIREFEK